MQHMKNPDKKDTQITVSAMVHNLPHQLVSEIYSQKRTVYPVSFFRKSEPYQIDYTQEEYELMIKGAYLANQKPHYLGNALPNNHPKSKEIQEMLVKLRVSIQYHPKYGMVILDETIK